MPIDYTEYPENWKEISEYIRFVRADNKCETCGAPNRELIYRPYKGKPDWKLAPEGMEGEAMALDGVKFTEVVLTVAHINHNKQDCRYNPGCYDPTDEDNNLVAECQRCHLKRDINNHTTNRKYGRNWKKKQIKLDL